MSSGKHESAVLTFSDAPSIEARHELFKLLRNYPGTDDEIERSLGLFIRGSLLARIFATGDIYRKITHLPGIVIDLGTWRGQTAVLCENFRAIFEPLHFNRRIVCFDTFEGYKGFSDKDKATDLHKDGTYGVGGKDYAAYLEHLLLVHEKNNAMGHNNGKHRVIVGDCRETVPTFFEENKNEFVALSFFDVNSYEPTMRCFKDIYARLVPGGIIAFWQLTRDSIAAEAMVYTQDILNLYPHRIERSATYPGLCYITKPQ
jgi:hypothetical protein